MKHLAAARGYWRISPWAVRLGLLAVQTPQGATRVATRRYSCAAGRLACAVAILAARTSDTIVRIRSLPHPDYLLPAIHGRVA